MSTLLWQEVITDRTQQDVNFIKSLLSLGFNNLSEEQKQLYLSGGFKGTLDKADLKRVENNMLLLSEVEEVQIESNLNNISMFPNVKYFSTLKENLQKLRDGYFVFTTTPKVPELPFNTWQKWNNIEKILSDLYELLNNNFYQYCDNGYYSGEDIGLL